VLFEFLLGIWAFVFYVLKSLVYTPTLGEWIRSYCDRNVRGYHVDFCMQHGELVSWILSRREKHSDVIEVPLGGWFTKCHLRVSDGRSTEYIKVRVESFGRWEQTPTLTLTDWQGSRLHDLTVAQVLTILKIWRKQDSAGASRIRLESIVKGLMSDEHGFSKLLLAVYDVLIAMDSTTRLIQSKEGQQMRALLTLRTSACLKDSDPRKERFKIMNRG
jgi:hypothetical protein